MVRQAHHERRETLCAIPRSKREIDRTLTQKSDDATLLLKPGKEKSLLRRHPWIFSGAVAKVSGSPESGSSVRVLSHDGAFLAWAAYSPVSNIRARVWSFDETEHIDADFFVRRVKRALASRPVLNAEQSPRAAVRLVHGESDGLPGVIADRYADTIVLQLSSTGAERWREEIVDALVQLTGCANVYERSDADVRALEDLAPRTGVLRGSPPTQIDIEEGTQPLRFVVDVAAGQKTGFYLDQAGNRTLLANIAGGKQVLNCFCYTGAFSIAALAGGAASVTSIDSSADALAKLAVHLRLNHVDPQRSLAIEADVFQALRKERDAGHGYDIIVLDPPKFAPTAAHAEKAARAYKDINLLGFKLLKPGGQLLTFSCSGGVDASLFQKIVAGAALDAQVDAQIERKLTAGPDHPVLLSFPEGEYLKGLLCRRLD
jgi:23S rRNA (cytosine1962-C5)-methyltransferase